jgi:hypothetical protein
MTSKEKPDTIGEWTQHCETFFQASSSPWDVKFEIEKTTGILLTRDQEQNPKLVFKGTSQPPPTGHRLELRLEAVLSDQAWYSLHDEMWLPRSWSTETEFRRDADRTFRYWTRNLRTGGPGSFDAASRELYDRAMRETLQRESEEANRKKDDAQIREIQQAVLAALRKGQSFATAHHEGSTRLYFSGTRFVKQEDGLEVSVTEFSTDHEMLACLRDFYDWESRKQTYPHRPPELDVWKFIQRQLR